MNCFYCQKEILENASTYIAFDVPYINLPVHKECDRLIDKQGVDEYIQANKQRFLDFVAQNTVTFGSQSVAQTGKKTKSKILAKPTKKTRKK